MTSVEPINHHRTCNHRTYKLTCEQFEALIERAGGACELCGRDGIKLHIDHDHDRSTDRPIRGLLCAACNSRMRFVDDGTTEPSEEVRAYLANAIPGPPMRNYMPPRTVRLEDQLWEATVAKAAANGETVADIIRRALDRYVKRS